MSDYDCSDDLKHGAPFQDYKNSHPINPPDYIKHRFPVPRRRPFPGRFPNRGFRPFNPPFVRKEFSMQRGFPIGYRQVSPSKYSPTMIPQGNFNSAFAGPLPNFYNRHSPQQMLSPRLNTNENFEIIKSDEGASSGNSRPNEECSPDMWVEAVAPTGRKYYHNARTRENTWEKPTNATIIELGQVQFYVPNMGQISNARSPSGPFARPLANFPYPNSFHPVPVNFSVPPPRGVIMFPPPSAAYNSPQIFANYSGVLTQNRMDSPAAVSNPVISAVPADSESKTGGSNSIDEVRNLCARSTETDAHSFTLDQNSSGKGYVYNESKILDWSTSSSKITLSSSNSAELEAGTLNKAAVIPGEDQLRCHQTKEIKSKVTADKSPSNITSGQTLKKQPKDKSRPVSSTPVSGTCWCVVWTGDGKVFFYDKTRKVSVWERPGELLNRPDVDKMVEKPILLQHEKPETAATRSDTSSKKLKKDGELKKCLDNSKKDILCTNEAVTGKKASAVLKIDEQRVKDFYGLLEEKSISAFYWERDVYKIADDPRYLAVSTLRERRMLFHRFVLEKMENEKNNILKQLNEQKENFQSLLREAEVNSKTHFSQFCQRYGFDVRFKAIDSMRKKENLFSEFVLEMAQKEKNEQNNEREIEKFIKLLHEQKLKNKNITWSEVEKMISHDDRYKAIRSNHSKESMFQEYIEKLRCTKSVESLDPSIDLSNTEVPAKKEASSHLRHFEFKSNLTRRPEVVSNFKALLNDFVKSAETDWLAARNMLKEDSRWGNTKISEFEKQELFKQHVQHLYNVNKQYFYGLLEKMPGFSLNSSWLEVKEVVLNASKKVKFPYSEKKCANEFKEYLRMKFQTAIDEFKELLKETDVNSFSFKTTQTCTNFLEDIEGILLKDKRYLALSSFPGERKVIILKYIIKMYNEYFSSASNGMET